MADDMAALIGGCMILDDGKISSLDALDALAYRLSQWHKIGIARRQAEKVHRKSFVHHMHDEGVRTEVGDREAAHCFREAMVGQIEFTYLDKDEQCSRNPGTHLTHRIFFRG
jgi:hypothetical protein